MGLINLMGKALGEKGEPDLSESQNDLFRKLQSRRQRALELIPVAMRKQYLSYIYSDKILRRFVSETYSQTIHRNKSDREAYFRLSLTGCVAINGFGARLLLHNIDPKYVVEIMLRDIDLPEN
jgi:hypothetical protein